MPEKDTHPSVQQTAIGNDNIQVIGSHNVITRITNFFAGDTEQQRAMRNRRAMLELVKNTWIKGVLEQSLGNEVLIDLGMEERPGEVEHSWDLQVKMPDQVNRTLPAGTSIIQVFDEMGGAILILGEPGSGKTTILLELARDCIARAQKDDTQPIPVVFNLSSWDRKQTIETWLISELNSKYNVSKKVAQSWIANTELLLLLDGLDEVKHENREACIRSLNDFRQQHGVTTQITVCSRVADYETLDTKLNLASALYLLPLTTKQIEAYCEQVGAELDGVHQGIQSDEALRELAQRPLMLGIIAQVFKDSTAEGLASERVRSVEDWRERLFNRYIQQMFGRIARTRNERYSSDQTKHKVGWLAQKMRDQAEPLFLIEQIQPSWLETSFQIKLYGILTRIISGLIVGITLAAFIGQLNWLVDGIVIGVLYGVVTGLNFHTSKTRTTANGKTSLFFPIITIGILGGIYSGVVFALRAQSHPWGIQMDVDRIVLHGLIDGVFFGFVGGAFFKLMNDKKNARKDIETTDALKWSWNSLLIGVIDGLLAGGLFGSLFGIVLGAIFALYGIFFDMQFGYGLWDGLKTGAGIGLFLGPTAGLSLMLKRGVLSHQVETQLSPNQGIWLSLRNGLLSGLFIAISSSVLFKLYQIINVSHLGATRTLMYSFMSTERILFLAIASGFIGFMFLGGSTVIKHLTLRFLLALNKTVPMQYARFLDHCCDLIFLRRVGGGYIFVHRLLMEHFADMYQEQQ